MRGYTIAKSPLVEHDVAYRTRTIKHKTGGRITRGWCGAHNNSFWRYGCRSRAWAWAWAWAWRWYCCGHTIGTAIVGPIVRIVALITIKLIKVWTCAIVVITRTTIRNTCSVTIVASSLGLAVIHKQGTSRPSTGVHHMTQLTIIRSLWMLC